MPGKTCHARCRPAKRSSVVGRGAPALVSLLQHEAVEVFVVLCLSTKGRVLGYYEVSRGTLDATLVHPRDVFKVAGSESPGHAGRRSVGHCP